MKKLFQATFEQSLKLNNDNVMIECLEKSSKRSIVYRLLGPWGQGGCMLFFYFISVFLLYRTIPKLLTTNILLGYILVYSIIYTIGQLIIIRYQLILSNLFFKILSGQSMIILMINGYITWSLLSYYLGVPMIILILIALLIILHVINFAREDYWDIFGSLYDEGSPIKTKNYEKFYQYIMKYGGVLVIGCMVIKWIISFFSSHPIENWEGYFSMMCGPFLVGLGLDLGVDYLLKSVNAYYLVKYSEEYREYYGFTVSEWYGKYSKRAMKERRMKRKNKSELKEL